MLYAHLLKINSPFYVVSFVLFHSPLTRCSVILITFFSIDKYSEIFSVRFLLLKFVSFTISDTKIDRRFTKKIIFMNRFGMNDSKILFVLRSTLVNNKSMLFVPLFQYSTLKFVIKAISSSLFFIIYSEIKVIDWHIRFFDHWHNGRLYSDGYRELHMCVLRIFGKLKIIEHKKNDWVNFAIKVINEKENAKIIACTHDIF